MFIQAIQYDTDVLDSGILKRNMAGDYHYTKPLSKYYGILNHTYEYEGPAVINKHISDSYCGKIYKRKALEKTIAHKLPEFEINIGRIY